MESVWFFVHSELNIVASTFLSVHLFSEASDALKDLGADLKVGFFTGFVFFLCGPSLVIVGDGAYHQSVLSFSHIAP